MTGTEAGPWIGASPRRKEDARLIRGQGRYVADIEIADTIEIAFVRSQLAHAEIDEIDTEHARRANGVIAVVTARDIEGAVAPFTRFVDQEHTPPGLESAIHPQILPCPIDVLARDRVRYVGEPIVAVIAENRYLAEDAAELVEIRFTELPVVVDPEAAREPGAPVLHDGVENNVQARFNVDVGDVDGAFASAHDTFSVRMTTQRLSASPMEMRGVLAIHDSVKDEITIWSSTQVPYMVRTRVAEQLDIAEQQVRVIAPDVGGGFGPKVQVYPEEILLAHLARTLHRPVRWIEDRREHLVSTAHSRDQVHFVDVATDDQGVITAIRDRFLLDCGAYNPFSITCAYNTAAHFRSLFKVPNFSITGECVLTNKTFNVPYRGAGRPEGTFAMDRIMYEVARRRDLDPVEVLRRNLISFDEMPYPRGMPYRDGNDIVYDCGDFSEALTRLLDTVEYDKHRVARAARADTRIRRGIGFGTYIEGTGIGPFESGTVQLDSHGRFVVYAGSTAIGQGHETTFSQVVADQFGVSPDEVIFRAGDTSLQAYGAGSFASRSAVNAGSAILVSSLRLKDKIKAIAGEIMEAAPGDLEINDGRVEVVGDPSHSVGLREIYQAAAPGPAARLPNDTEPGAEETSYFVPPTVTWGHGMVAAVVEVDVETGFVDVKRLAIAHDCGRIINPTVVEGQIDGGLVQGIGAAMYEQLAYSDQGQPLTTTLMDYLLPTSAEVPRIDQFHLETPSDRNPLGVKGVGEAGIIAPPAAIANAVVDALAEFDVHVDELPIFPASLSAKIQEYKKTNRRI